MKIEMKKIALAVTLGMMSFCWAFGIETGASIGGGTGLKQPLPSFNKIKVTNYMQPRTAILFLNNEQNPAIKVVSENDQNDIPTAEIRQVSLNLQDKMSNTRRYGIEIINWNSEGTKGDATLTSAVAGVTLPPVKVTFERDRTDPQMLDIIVRPLGRDEEANPIREKNR